MYSFISKKKYVGGLVASAMILSGSAAYVYANTGSDNTREGKGPAIVVEINANGKILLRGTVTSVASSSLAVKSWGGSWTVNVASDTEIYPKVTGTSDLTYFKVGDIVGVKGSVVENATLTVNARLVRNWTERKEKHDEKKAVKDIMHDGRESGVGRIFSGDVGAVASTSFAFTSDSKNFTVNTSGSTKLLNKTWLPVVYADIHQGDHVQVFGTAASSTITAQVVRDASLPR